MEIRQLRYFLDIAETEHLTQSAQNLFVTQSTLSHGLRQLEEELDVQLFVRLGRGLRLSQAGMEFRAYASRALQEVEAGRMALADLPAPDLFIRTGGELRISNFLLWQLAYSELWFTDTLWPDVDDATLQQALDAYAGRERRYGLTSAQVTGNAHGEQH